MPTDLTMHDFCSKGHQRKTVVSQHGLIKYWVRVTLLKFTVFAVKFTVINSGQGDL